MSQSRLQSAIEAFTGTTVGGVGSWLIVYGVLRLNLPPAWTATLSVVLCAAWSFGRSYFLRRWFAGREAPKAVDMEKARPLVSATRQHDSSKRGMP